MKRAVRQKTSGAPDLLHDRGGDGGSGGVAGDAGPNRRVIDEYQKTGSWGDGLGLGSVTGVSGARRREVRGREGLVSGVRVWEGFVMGAGGGKNRGGQGRRIFIIGKIEDTKMTAHFD